MERSRDYLPVRIGTWSKKNFLAFCALILVCLITTMGLGILQSRQIPYFITKEPNGNSGTDLDILNSECVVDVYGNPIDDTNCYAHYFKIEDFFTQYFSVDAYFTVKDQYIKDGAKLPMTMKLTWVGRSGEQGTCKSDGCTDCLKNNEQDPANCLKAGSKGPCARCNVPCYRCIRSLGLNCDTSSSSSSSTSTSSDQEKTAKDKILQVCSNSEEIDSYTHWDELAQNQTVTRTLRCRENDKSCLPMVLFKTTHVEYHNYYFRLSMHEVSQEQKNIIDLVSFKYLFQNPKFSVYKLVFKYIFFGINLMAFILFECQICKRNKLQQRSRSSSANSNRRMDNNNHNHGGDVGRGNNNNNTIRRRQSLRMQAKQMSSKIWVRLLLIGLMFFNNPLNVFEYISELRRFFGVLGVLFELFFMGILFAFWLVEFDDLSDDDEDITGGRFHKRCCLCFKQCTCVCATKTIIILLFLVVGAVTYSWIKMTEFTNPLYDFHEDPTGKFIMFYNIYIILYI